MARLPKEKRILSDVKVKNEDSDAPKPTIISKMNPEPDISSAPGFAKDAESEPSLVLHSPAVRL